MSLVLSLYLAKQNMPVPVWSPQKGFRIIRYPVHQVFSVSWSGSYDDYITYIDDCRNVDNIILSIKLTQKNLAM